MDRHCALTRPVLNRMAAALLVALLLGAVMFLPVPGSLASEASHSSPELAQTTVTLTPVADATVASWDRDGNFGGDDVLKLFYGGPNEEAVTLLRFDLASGLPGNAIIDSAILKLFLVDAAGAERVGVGAYYVTSGWSEGSVTWNTFPTAQPVGILSQVDASPGSYKSWGVTSFAQAWHSGANHGLYLRGPTDGTYYERVFESREWMEHVPQLEVTYHLPAPEPTWTPLPGPTDTPPPGPTDTRPPPAPKVTPPPLRCPEGEVLYEEDLNDGRAQGWELDQTESGRWMVSEDALVGTGHVWAGYTRGNWGDGCVLFKLTCLQGGLHANVRLSDMGRYAIGLVHEDNRLRVYLLKQLWPDTFNYPASGEIDYGPSSVEREIEMRQGIDVLIETWGGQILVSVEGYDRNPVIHHRDPDPLPPGSIAFESHEESRVCVDDILVIGEPVPAPPPTKLPPTRRPTERPPTPPPATPVPPTEPPPTRRPTRPTPTPRIEPPLSVEPWLPVAAVVILVGGLLGGAAFLLWRRGRGGMRGREEKRLGVIGEPETYYYVSGTPVSVRRRDDLIAVKFRGIDSSSAAARSGVGTDVPGFGPPAVEDLWPGGEVLLRQLPGKIRSPQEQESLFRALNQRADVERASFVYELNPDDHWIATDQLVAQFRAAMSESDIAALNREYGVEQVERIPWLPRAYLLQVTPASPGDALSVANVYVESEQVVFAHPNFLRKYAHRIAVLQPDAALAARHWHLSAIQAFEAWQISSGNPDVVVAIIDDGTDLDHAAFPNQVGEHYNVIDRSGDPRPPAEKAKHYAHGTACAGLAVGAPKQEIGTSGVAPGCQLMAIRMLDRVIPLTVEEKLEEVLTEAEEMAMWRVLSEVESYREARALQWASEHGADVISNSWGPPDGYAKFGKEFPIDDIVRLALTEATERGRDGKGCVVCWAAGNGNESISFDGYASRPEVLAVGACTVEGKRAPYSDYGPEVDISAPGGGYKEGLLTTVDVDLKTHQAYRHNFNGTSAAAPVVAAVAALLLSVNPDLTREEVYNILRDTADKIDPEGGQYDNRGHSPFYGWGRVNARRALQRAAQH